MKSSMEINGERDMFVVDVTRSPRDMFVVDVRNSPKVTILHGFIAPKGQEDSLVES